MNAWRATLDGLADAVFVHDADFCIIRCNRAYAILAGLPFEAILGRPYYEVFPVRDGPMAACASLQGYTNDDIMDLGDGRVFVSHGYPIANEDGSHSISVHLLQNLSARVSAERSRKVLSHAVRHVDHGVLAFDADGKVTLVNNAMLRIVGRARDDVHGALVAEVCGLPAQVIDNIIALGPAGDEWHGTTVTRSFDGDPITVRVDAMAVDGDRARSDTLMFFADITALHQSQATVSRLMATVERLSLEVDVEPVVREALAAAVELTGARFAGVALLQDNGQRYAYRWLHGLGSVGEALVGVAHPLERGIAGAVFSAQEPRVVDGYGAWDGGLPEWHAALGRSELRDARTLAVPMRNPAGTRGVLMVTGLRGAVHARHLSVLETLGRQVCVALQREANVARARDADRRTQDAFIATVTSIARASEARDPYTTGHQQAVARLAVAIGGKLGLAEQRLIGLKLGALVHDIGKLGVPVDVLTQPGPLDAEQITMVRAHPMLGVRILGDTEYPWPVRAIVGQHHERIDGSGYPDGLDAVDIALEAQIVAVADVFDAVCNDRPYRRGLGAAEALAVLSRDRGVGLNADAVDACIELIRTDTVVL